MLGYPLPYAISDSMDIRKLTIGAKSETKKDKMTMQYKGFRKNNLMSKPIFVLFKASFMQIFKETICCSKKDCKKEFFTIFAPYVL